MCGTIQCNDAMCLEQVSDFFKQVRGGVVGVSTGDRFGFWRAGGLWWGRQRSRKNAFRNLKSDKRHLSLLGYSVASGFGCLHPRYHQQGGMYDLNIESSCLELAADIF